MIAPAADHALNYSAENKSTLNMHRLARVRHCGVNSANPGERINAGEFGLFCPKTPFAILILIEGLKKDTTQQFEMGFFCQIQDVDIRSSHCFVFSVAIDSTCAFYIVAG